LALLFRFFIQPLVWNVISSHLSGMFLPSFTKIVKRFL
jgi:hypothetical protein